MHQDAFPEIAPSMPNTNLCRCFSLDVMNFFALLYLREFSSFSLNRSILIILFVYLGGRSINGEFQIKQISQFTSWDPRECTNPSNRRGVAAEAHQFHSRKRVGSRMDCLVERP